MDKEGVQVDEEGVQADEEGVQQTPEEGRPRSVRRDEGSCGSSPLSSSRGPLLAPHAQGDCPRGTGAARARVRGPVLMDISEGAGALGSGKGGPDSQEPAQATREPQGWEMEPRFSPLSFTWSFPPAEPSATAPEGDRGPLCWLWAPGRGVLGLQGQPSHLPAL